MVRRRVRQRMGARFARGGGPGECVACAIENVAKNREKTAIWRTFHPESHVSEWTSLADGQTDFRNLLEP